MNIVRQSQATKEPSLLARDWDPFRAMRELMRWDPFRQMTPQAMDFVPEVDVKETPNELLFKVDVPGMSEKDIEISLTGNRMTISGKREEEKKSEQDRYYVVERSSGSFSRMFTLPEGVDLDSVRADLANGVLTLIVPKKGQAEPRRVDVNAASSAGATPSEGNGGGGKS
jgi:HSP20 family protein